MGPGLGQSLMEHKKDSPLLNLPENIFAEAAPWLKLQLILGHINSYLRQTPLMFLRE